MTWHRYFDLEGIAMRHVFPTVMIPMMSNGTAALAKKLGGKGARIARV